MTLLDVVQSVVIVWLIVREHGDRDAILRLVEIVGRVNDSTAALARVVRRNGR